MYSPEKLDSLIFSNIKTFNSAPSVANTSLSLLSKS